jgi:cytochrome c5
MAASASGPGALFVTALAAALIAAPAAGQQSRPQFPEFADPRLKQGRGIWLQTCEACHANDIAGAPLVADKGAWKPRLAKGKETLYRSALNGLTGPKGTQMPPRGGNDKLADDEVRAAVDYMMAIVR